LDKIAFIDYSASLLIMSFFGLGFMLEIGNSIQPTELSIHSNNPTGSIFNCYLHFLQSLLHATIPDIDDLRLCILTLF